jgi:hypothetical protein
VLSLAKQQQILEFITELDENIQQLEDYETKYEIDINELVLENLSDETILEIQKRYIDEVYLIKYHLMIDLKNY